METTTLLILMAAALVLLAVLVGVLVLRLFHKNDELREKNDVIVREIRRNQLLIDRAVQHGVSRAAMLSFSLLLLVGSVSVLTSCTKDDDTILSLRRSPDTPLIIYAGDRASIYGFSCNGAREVALFFLPRRGRTLQAMTVKPINP